MELNDVFQSIIDGTAVLITGSGAHMGALNSSGTPFPSGYILAKSLYEKSGIMNPDNPWDLQDASETYLENNNTLSLINYIKNELRVGLINEEHRELYDNAWQRVYTTNYDAVPLVATSSGDNGLVPITLSRNYKSKLLVKNLCIYINGYIEQLDERSINDEFKLTSKSYLSAKYLEDSPWGILFSEDLSSSSCVVIVGLSLDYDLDIKRFIYNKNIKEKLVFIEAPGISNDKRRKMNRLGQVCSIGMKSFVDQLSEYKKSHDAKEVIVHFYKAFEKYHSKRVTKAASAIDVYGLYIYGEYRKNQNLWHKRYGKYWSIVNREELLDAVHMINKGCKVLYIHANLGNGKTIFVEMLKDALRKEHYNVFTLVDSISSITGKEVKQITEEDGKTVVIIENYFNYMSIIEEFSLYDWSNIQFVFTARTVLFDTWVLDVGKLLGLSAGESCVIDLNKLRKSELSQLSAIFNNNGLWGELNSIAKQERLKKLESKQEGNREFQSILYGLLKSEDISNRFSIIVENIRKSNKKYYEVIVLALLVKTMSLNLDIEDIGKALNINIAFDAVFRNDANVKELIEFSEYGTADYIVKSSITARMLLQELKSSDVIIETLVKTATYADKYRTIEKYESLLKNIVSYSHVNTFLGEKNRNKEYLLVYYNGLKELQYYKENSFFWLQYAIACINIERFDLAQKFIDNSYSFFKISSLSVPFQIDTTQAVLYLERIKNGETPDLISDFKRAHKLLMTPTVSDKDNPIKQLTNFRYYEDSVIRSRLIKAGDGDFYKIACGEAYNKINKFLKNDKLISIKNRQNLEGLAQRLLGDAI